MFSLRRWFSEWRMTSPLRERYRGPVIVALDDLDANDLADRVHSRLREVRDTEDSLQVLFKIVGEEAYEQRLMRRLREVMQMRELMHKLPPRQRSVLVDHVERGLSYKQIARERGLTERIVLRDLTRAYATLRINLGSDNERASNDDHGNDGPSTASAGLSGLRFAETYVGVVGGVRDGGPPTERIPGGSDDQRFPPGGPEG